MIKIKAILLGFILFTFSSALLAQNGKIKFEKTIHDYGTIKEEIGKATAKFMFTNIGTGDLKIVKVTTSCGCTASDYSKNVIKPGEKGYVSAIYFTAHRPGPFRKSITVIVNDADHPNSVLFIKGTVTPKMKSKGDFYPTAIGNLKLMSNHIAFNEIATTDIRTDSLKVFNNWDHPMEIGFTQVPSHITVKAVPSTLQPKAEGYLVVTFDANKKYDFGLVYDRIGIKTNDIVQPLKTLNVSANLTQDFSNLTEKQLKKAPKIIFDNSTYDFGKVKSGTVIKFSYVFKNEGKQELIIHKVKSSCGCTATKPAATHVKKGKSSEIEVTFDTGGRRGRQHKTITLITNDPINSQVILNVQGELLP